MRRAVRAIDGLIALQMTGDVGAGDLYTLWGGAWDPHDSNRVFAPLVAMGYRYAMYTARHAALGLATAYRTPQARQCAHLTLLGGAWLTFL